MYRFKHLLLSLIALLLSLLFGCALRSNDTKNQNSAYPEFITVDVFDSLANFQGYQSGWFAKIVKDKFNMQLNIIAPNVTGGGDSLFETRCASGNLGDLIICSNEGAQLQKLVDAGLVLNLEPYFYGKQILRFEEAIVDLNRSLNRKGMFAVPSELSTNPATTSSDITEPTYGPYVRWDLYEALGSPTLRNRTDLLETLKAMQELYPFTPDGTPTYAFSFFRDWDGNLMNAAKQPCCFYGYDEFGFLLVKADGTAIQSIADSDSLYMETLQLYFEANQLGLVDPESANQNYDQLYNKYQNGSVLYCPWPWLCQSAFHTPERLAQGIGYKMAPVMDMQIYSYGCYPLGNQNNIICVGSGAKDPKRLADFIDWLYSPEGIMIAMAQEKDGTAGPRGLTWDVDEDGEPYLTEFGRSIYFEGGKDVPEEWGGGTWVQGVSALNFKPVSRLDQTPEQIPYYYGSWESVRHLTRTNLDVRWEAHSGCATTIEYLKTHHALLVAPGTGFVSSRDSSELSVIRSQCRKLITDYSWRLVFAKDTAEFYLLQGELQAKLAAVGYEQVIAKDYADALQLIAARGQNYIENEHD